MSYLLDTDICIYILNGGNPKLQKRFMDQGGSRLCVSTLTEAELHYGALHSSRPQKNRQRISLFLDPLEIIPFDSQGAEAFARIKETLVKKGKPIGAIDMLIAATALSNRLTLITNNVKHFAMIPELSFENWLEPSFL